MRVFNWLHLTDLHYGLTEQVHLWPNVRTSLFEDLGRIHDTAGPWHAVLFTGDLVQSGDEKEFNALTDEVFGPLWERLSVLGSPSPTLLTVPGNHDLSRPKGKHPSAALRQLLRPQGLLEVSGEFWDEPDSEYRQVIDEAFKNYQSWLRAAHYRNGVQIAEGLLPGDFAASIELAYPTTNLKIGIAGVNTTFLQLIAGDFEKKLAWHVKQLHQACGEDISRWAHSHDACILLTHQGPSWLDEQSREDTYPEINPAGRFAVHLFGHMHDTAVRSAIVGGGESIRLWQTRSLFGLEKYGEPPTFDRQHGYSAGRLQFDEQSATIRLWPRRAFKDANGWRFGRDDEKCILREFDGGTEPDSVVRKNSVATAGKTFSGSYPDAAMARTPSPPAKPHPVVPTISKWSWPYQEPKFRPYCEAVCKAHSHIRFVEIPHLKDVSDVEMDSLYVEPHLCVEELDPDLPTFRWPLTLDVLSVLRGHRHVVLLGDPGSGKSTLVSCIAWQLCRPTPSPTNALAKQFAGCIPIPMILRELRLKADITWEGLLDAFLEHRIGRLLGDRQTIQELLNSGRAVVLLDGLDEVGNLAIRRRLKDAVHEGLAASPNSIWLLTSRVVGYDAVPFHYRVEEAPRSTAIRTTDGKTVSSRNEIQVTVAERFFLAPFNDDQIGEFSLKWYTQHEREQEVIALNAEGFVNAIRENSGTQRLARIPYLLTLMALIHHKNARLPHGRTELYERIATAYLESIDVRRHLDQLPYSLSQKKRWLAYVAYQMQLRRSKGANRTEQSQILASNQEVERWIKDAMTESIEGSADEAKVLLDYFAKRSGLLLPRGEGKFAFMHLSLQEYFAACFMEARLTASRFASDRRKHNPSDKQLRAWANDEGWREAFVLLFELLSEKSISETEAFLKHLFEGRLPSDTGGQEFTAAGLLAELATDPFVSFTAETRRKCRQDAWRWMFKQGERSHYSRNNVTRAFVREAQGDLQRAWKAAALSEQELVRVKRLDLSGCSSLCDLSPLRLLQNLEHLELRQCPGIRDLSVLGELKGLKLLDLDGCATGCAIESVVVNLEELNELSVSEPLDLSCLSHLTKLRCLHLHFPIEGDLDLSALARLQSLEMICCEPGRRVMLANEFVANPSLIISPGVRSLYEESSGRRRIRVSRDTQTSRGNALGGSEDIQGDTLRKARLGRPRRT